MLVAVNCPGDHAPATSSGIVGITPVFVLKAVPEKIPTVCLASPWQTGHLPVAPCSLLCFAQVDGGGSCLLEMPRPQGR
jgi:hypothetical protein